MADSADRHWWFVGRRQILSRLIHRRIDLPRDAQILEVGCGTGHNLSMLSEFGRVDATEIDKPARALASAKLGRPVLDASLPELKGINGKYDLIALFDVLEHVEDDLGALKGLESRLKPGGVILVTVPGAPWMWSAHDVAHHHFRRYTKGRLRKVASEAHLAVDYLSPFNTILYPIVAAHRILGRLSKSEHTDDALPPDRVNSTLTKVFGLESVFIGRFPFPVGVSMAAIMRKAAHGETAGVRGPIRQSR